LDNPWIVLVVVIAAASALGIPGILLLAMRHHERIALDHYGKYRGSGPAKSFVCPTCLSRSYAPSHIARRWCVRCQKEFPAIVRAAAPGKASVLPSWFTEDLKATE